MTADEVSEFTRCSNKGELIVFEDKDGNMHGIFGARRVRADGVPYIILSETYRGFGFKTERADEELTETLNEYNEHYFNHRDGKI